MYISEGLQFIKNVVISFEITQSYYGHVIAEKGMESLTLRGRFWFWGCMTNSTLSGSLNLSLLLSLFTNKEAGKASCNTSNESKTAKTSLPW